MPERALLDIAVLLGQTEVGVELGGFDDQDGGETEYFEEQIFNEFMLECYV